MRASPASATRVLDTGLTEPDRESRVRSHQRANRLRAVVEATISVEPERVREKVGGATNREPFVFAHENNTIDLEFQQPLATATAR